MHTFAFVKLLSDTVDGKNEVKLHVSKIHKFRESSHHPFQEYKIDLENGLVGLGTIIFLAESEEKMDSMIAKGNRIRPPNRKFIKPAADTTDSEREDKKKEKCKRNYSKQPANALENRLQSLAEKRVHNNSFEATLPKKSKSSVVINKSGKDSKAAKTHKKIGESSNLIHSPVFTKTVSKSLENFETQELPLSQEEIINESMNQRLQGRNEKEVPEKENFSNLDTETSSSTISGKRMADQSSLNRTTPSKEDGFNFTVNDNDQNELSKETSKNEVSIAKSAGQSSLNRGTSFQKAMFARQQKQSERNLNNEKRKSSTLNGEVQTFKKLLRKEREKVLDQERKINLLSEELELSKKSLEERSKELKKARDLNERWQNLGITKCATMDAMFNELKKTRAVEHNELFPPVGHITDDKSLVHLGHGEWISYNTYVLAMNGVSIKNKRTFPKNMCVGIFGYDVLSKSTISGKGSNRNGNSKKPESKLDPNKLLAIREIYRHFLVNNLHMPQNEADQESFKVNQAISSKISSVKELCNKPKKPTRQLLGEKSNREKILEKELSKEGSDSNEKDAPSEDEMNPRIEVDEDTSSEDEVYLAMDKANDVSSEHQAFQPSHTESETSSEEEIDLENREEVGVPSIKKVDTLIEDELDE